MISGILTCLANPAIFPGGQVVRGSSTPSFLAACGRIRNHFGTSTEYGVSKMELPIEEHGRLKKFAGMLGSNHDGEVLAAVRKIRLIADKHRTPIADLLMGGGAVREKIVRRTETVYQPAAMGWEEPLNLSHGLSIALRFPNLLNDWEKSFCRDVSGRSRLTPKQATKAEQIINKIRRHAPASRQARPNL